MTPWMIWTTLATALVALAAMGLERAAALVRLPRRFVWIVALATITIAPPLLAFRVAVTPGSPALGDVPQPLKIQIETGEDIDVATAVPPIVRAILWINEWIG